MINKNVMSVFAIVAVATMMGAASIAPAYAASKLVDIDDHFDFNGPTFGDNCGDDVLGIGTIDVRVVIWDNQKSVTNIKTHILLTNEDGGPSGVFHSTSSDVISPLNGDNIWPVMIQANGKVTCNGTGQVTNDHFGLTVHKDGTTNFHFSP